MTTEAPTLVPTFWGSVNTWECDENNHLNVRFFAHKINQAVQAWAADVTGDPALTRAVPGSIRAQHIRFLREARAATPLRIDCGLLGRHGTKIEVLSLLCHNLSSATLAAFRTVLDTAAWSGAGLVAPLVTPPPEAAPRGIDPARDPNAPDTRAEAIGLGYRIVGRGVIGADECDADGNMLPHVYIGRISGSMPNLWAFLSSAEEQSARGDGALGGAALEYRIVIREALCAGDVYTQTSGIRELGRKTQTMVHVLFNERTGRVAATATAVGVAMDLTTRRAVPISDERRARLGPLLLRDAD
jgi:acyl-CoA thioester hydrolase